MRLTSLEICAGGGGQALGLEQAGFEHVAVAEIDPDACNTLRANRPGWKVIEGDIRGLDGRQFAGIDLVAGGPPCQPWSVGGKQLSHADGRDLFPEALRIIGEARPRAVMLENVPGLAQRRFASYRAQVLEALDGLGYETLWGIRRASEFGVSQVRPRMVLTALLRPAAIPEPLTTVTLLEASGVPWPRSVPSVPPTVGEVLQDLMAEHGWEGAAEWARAANALAPTIVGGSKKHGGPDLGPTRAREAWLRLSVDGRGIAATAPEAGWFGRFPRLTVRMVARLQGFPDNWEFTGRKTAAYRQVGNAFCPPAAQAFGIAIAHALGTET